MKDTKLFTDYGKEQDRLGGKSPIASTANNLPSENKRANKMSPIQALVHHATALLANIAAGFDVNSHSANAQTR